MLGALGAVSGVAWWVEVRRVVMIMKAYATQQLRRISFVMSLQSKGFLSIRVWLSDAFGLFSHASKVNPFFCQFFWWIAFCLKERV